jgi:hypothetical protein
MQGNFFGVLLGFLVVTASTLRAQQLSCPTTPDSVTTVHHDVHSDVQVSVGSLGNLKAGDARVETDVVASNLFGKYPNTDRILIVQMMAATYCSMIRDSTTTKESDKLLLWAQFSERIFRFENPDYHPAHATQRPATQPQVTQQSTGGTIAATRSLLTEIQAFNQARPAETASYGWQQYVDDTGVLHRRAMDFYDLLRRSNPTYQNVSSIYLALDEAADELSLRGRVMHDSGQVGTENYDRHIFVGPGWFHLSLQELRRAHEKNSTLTDKQIAAFGSDIDYWKLCWSGTAQNSSNCR